MSKLDDILTFLANNSHYKSWSAHEEAKKQIEDLIQEQVAEAYKKGFIDGQLNMEETNENINN